MSIIDGYGVPYLQRIQALPERIEDVDAYPFNLAVIRTLDLTFGAT